jgi:hypothetical protein
MKIIESLITLKHSFSDATDETSAASRALAVKPGDLERVLNNSGAGMITRLSDGGSMEDFPDGAKIYRNGAQLIHRDNGAAVLLPNGVKAWYTEGVCIRKDQSGNAPNAAAAMGFI